MLPLPASTGMVSSAALFGGRAKALDEQIHTTGLHELVRILASLDMAASCAVAARAALSNAAHVSA